MSDSVEISEIDYTKSFADKREKTFQYALDTRKFEIDLYWKRATYFWTFIAATFAGYAAIQAASSIEDKADLSVILCCLGVLFSFGWHCVNRGSKQWQENWENHVDMLEDEVTGPLFKTVLRRRPAKNWKEHIGNSATGPWPISVSGVNQIISMYVVIFWLILLIKSLRPFSVSAPVDWVHAMLVISTFISCIGFVTVGRTFNGAHEHAAKRRQSHIEPRA
ncbi:hypothetical protein [Vreelandella olivaria]|uniref:RipA family octameric membrane protein n=1 Tax=Vreelandella olivaria TaxID=390919 RepID=UPI00201E9453|nr:hypothetical protein [Halomonas olivaria]